MRFQQRKAVACLISIIALSGCQQSASPASAPTQAEHPTAPQPSPVTAHVTYDGPFGLRMGLSPAEAKAATSSLEESDQGPGIYRTNSVPVSHPDFESYSLLFSQKSGLCKVVAIGKDIQSGDTGYEVRSAFDAIDKAITGKYGKGKKYDFTSERYDSPEFWMMYLLKKNRTLAKVWSKEEGSSLTSNLGSITLEAGATDMSTGYLVMRYEFQNMSDCVAEGEAEKNKGL
ncbi:hypothetical protein [Lysobacter niastensis]|uniref:Lipoprotein n=1 Tax=Lysobacter niastensis TaxID=380629 RepID=A0ABS0B6M5_9GAMM|nr:hypothetical protein [Lysobacter niastensis]MBF6022800.1 hypothetical protein [Lysobacter niastensis]